MADEYFRDFVEHAADGMRCVGPDGTIRWANRAELDLLGYSHDEYVGRPIAEFHVDRAVIDDILARLRRNEVIRGREARMRCKDGSIRHVVIHSNALWRGGEFIHARCVTRDITEQKRAERERLRALRQIAAEHAVTSILADSRPFDEAVPRLLQEVGEVGDWHAGALWIVDETIQEMRCAAFWRVPELDVRDFETITRHRTFMRGIGLPGRIWASGEPAWIDELRADPNFPRAPAASAAGLQSALGFPVRGIGRLAGVLEFFSTEVRPPDIDLLQLFAAVGTQIGHFIERRSAEEIRERLAAIVDSSDDAIISKTLDGVITSWNRGAQQMYGYTAAEAIGRHIRLIVPENLHAEEEDVLARLRRGGRIDHYETERQTKDGRRLSVSLTVSPIRNADGEVVGASKVARDITHRKQAEAALRASGERAQAQARMTRLLNRVGATVAATLDRSSIVQTVTDLATEIITAQFGAFFYNVVDRRSGESYLLYTLSGAPREAFAGLPMPRATELFEPTFRGEKVIRLDDVTADPRYGRSAPYFGMPPGHLPVRSYLAVPVRGRSGDVLGGLFFGHSTVGMFTEQHEELVEGIAAWASIALENARLLDESERAVQTRDEFLSMAAHELRNPLNALQLQLVGLQRSAQETGGALPAEWVAERLRQAIGDVGTLVHLVHNLLDVARITAGRMDLEPEPLDFGAVVRAVAERLGQQAGGAPVSVDAPPTPGRCDRLRFELIVTNLVSNALKYGLGRPVDVSLRADGEAVVLVVTDRGIGIAPEQRSRLFERFSRAVPRRQHGGFGLGLWITRETVRAMRGQIALESEPGAGSTVSVTLPRRLDEASGHLGQEAQAATGELPTARMDAGGRV